LKDFASLIDKNRGAILAANAKDVGKAYDSGKNAAFIDRLNLNEKRIDQMIEGIEDIIKLPDPVGEVVESYYRPNGLLIKKIRSPLGVIAVIFEARPNVAADAAALSLKSGNGIVLRGSRGAEESVALIAGYAREAVSKNGYPADLVLNIAGPREVTAELLQSDKFIDVVIPRGGDDLKKAVLEQAAMPVIASYGGNCHVYVAASADEDMAVKVVLNAKTNRPATCNAAETLLIDRKKSPVFIVRILKELVAHGVEVRGDSEITNFYPAKLVTENEYFSEYDDMIIKAKLVSGLKEAAEHINRFGSGHSDAIITSDKAEGEKFVMLVDSAATYVNASTRFTDGYEFGLGAEMGISTQKLHARGPIGLKELTSVRYAVFGDGQIRN
jgi:gamma-glutamyl phosphate reductase